MHEISKSYLIRKMSAQELIDLYKVIQSKISDDIVEPDDLLYLNLIKENYKQLTGLDIKDNN